MVHFAARTGWDLTENHLTQVLAEARATGKPLTDLTESNPTRCGLADATPLVALLGDPAGARYEPSALGHPSARAAVAGYYEARGIPIDPARVVLSASTSEAYGWLFKLLAERGDEVLIPAPSYPLFEFLACLEDITLTPYPLVREEGYRVDLDALERAAGPKARAIILVHPNNPTGTFVRREEADALTRFAAERGLALIVDEVFGDYAHGPLPPDRLPSFAGRDGALTFVLSGLSKVVAMPQLKLGWVAVSGPDALAREAMQRLEVIADTYLSVATPVQLALPRILAARGPVQRAILERVRQNLAVLDAALAAAGGATRRLPVDGGWYAVLQVPRWHDEDGWVELLVRDEGLIVHPGYFFDMPRDGFLVVSLLPEATPFADAAHRLAARLSR
ncbi:pyridoxal phosphate-dependent aminotransferase [Chondromyces crocatus]|uniref:Aminotransferase n=1 Tax=Chondromyces crocatus TaxID=52 RepID=A0A0K1ELR5_CHOCO|nr:pyridoxal phosphate-dependent aminotransferase [Chondromyces crocatus]AKT41840.1 aminotransferase [Chondromyces crocatus]